MSRGSLGQRVSALGVSNNEVWELWWPQSRFRWTWRGVGHRKSRWAARSRSVLLPSLRLVQLRLSCLSGAHRLPFITKRPQSLGKTAGPGSLYLLYLLYLFLRLPIIYGRWYWFCTYVKLPFKIHFLLFKQAVRLKKYIHYGKSHKNSDWCQEILT